MTWLTVQEALELLKKEGITESDQVVRRWLREGKLKGVRSTNRKEGWRVDLEHLKKFISERKPIDITTELTKTIKTLREAYEEVKNEREALKIENKRLKEMIAELQKSNSSSFVIEMEEVKNVPLLTKTQQEEKKESSFATSLPVSPVVEEMDQTEEIEGVAVELEATTLGQAQEDVMERMPDPETESVEDESVVMTIHYVEKIWQRITKDSKEEAGVLQIAREVLFSTLFKEGEQIATVERTKKGYFYCPFRSPRRSKSYKTFTRLVETAIPVLIKYAKIQKKREKERQMLGY
jgi:hypothetical protein